MQAGRELDARELDVKVAEEIGWNFREYEEIWISTTADMNYKELPKFSTTWEGMGVLVEEARKQGNKGCI